MAQAVGTRVDRASNYCHAKLCEFCEHWYIRPCTHEMQARCPNIVASRDHPKASAQVSIRHHYIPVFYLKRWRGDDGKICQFHRPYKCIYTKRVYPVQTGFVDRLYEMKGVPAEMAQVVEDEFMKSVDTLAARSLEMLETNNDRINYESKYRSAWSLFLMTLLTRMPEDLEVLRQVIADDWNQDFPKMEAMYAAKRKPDDPPTLHEFIEKNDPDYISRWTLDAAHRLMDNEGVGQRLNDMLWLVLTTKEDDPHFLTSDRPLVISLAKDDAYVRLPLGPNRLFLAVNDERTGQLVRQRPVNELIDEMNKLVVQHALKYAYGTDDGHVGFVDENIGKDQPKSLMQRLRDHRKAKAISDSKPAP